MISHQVESDVTSPSSDNSVSFKITPEVTHGDDHATDENADDFEDQGHVMGNVQDSTAVERVRRNLYKPSWLTTI